MTNGEYYSIVLFIKKGGNFDLAKFKMVEKKFAREYEFSGGTVKVYTKDY